MNNLANELAVRTTVNQVILTDRSNSMNNNLNLNNNKIINVKYATDNSDAVNFQQLNNSVSTVTNVSEILYLKIWYNTFNRKFKS